MPPPDVYIPLLACLGALMLFVSWLPMVLKEMPLSLPIVCVAIGVAAFGLFPSLGGAATPLEFPALTERLTELVVLVALTGAGLKLDRKLSWRGWIATWRLLGITMPLPEVVPAGTIMGHITAAAAQACNLRNDVPVTVALGDHQASLMGSGCTRAGSCSSEGTTQTA